TPRPATRPAKETRPAATARTGAPGAAARSTPRCPRPYAVAGGSQPRSTGGRVPTGQVRATAGTVPSSRTGPTAAADSQDGGGGASSAATVMITSRVSRTAALAPRLVRMPAACRERALTAGTCGRPPGLWTTASPAAPRVPYTSGGDPGHRVDFARPGIGPGHSRKPDVSAPRSLRQRRLVGVRRGGRPAPAAQPRNSRRYGHG